MPVRYRNGWNRQILAAAPAHRQGGRIGPCGQFAAIRIFDGKSWQQSPTGTLTHDAAGALYAAADGSSGSIVGSSG